MRDIRGDLQDRASFLEEQINAAQAQFEKLVEQLKQEHEVRLEELKDELEAVTTLMEVEHRRLTAVTSAPEPEHRRPASMPPAPEAEHHRRPTAPEAEHHRRPAAPEVEHRRPAAMASAPEPEQHRRPSMAPQPQPQPLQPLADFLLRKLSEAGAMSRDDLLHFAIQEGYFADGEIAERGVHATLMNVVKAGFIRQLPNGTFAPATVMDTIRLRRAI